MAVAEISGPKLVIRMPDVDLLSGDAEGFFIERVRPHPHDESICIIPFYDHDQWRTDAEALLGFGFDFFVALFLPYDERSWAKRVCVKYLSDDMPRAQILWINPSDPFQVFNGRSFEVCSYQEFHETIALRRLLAS